MMTKLHAHHERMMACLGKTEAMDLEANPEEMQSEAEHLEVPKEEAAVKSSGIPKKWHKGQNVAAGHHQKPKEQTQGSCGSQKKLAAAHRGMTHHAGVAWRRDAGIRDKTRTMLHQEPRKDKSMRRDFGRAQNAKWE
jgi:hypothetical protein